MTVTTAEPPTHRQRIHWARAVVAAPEDHKPAEVHEACDLLIHFGGFADLNNACQLRGDIESGVIIPGARRNRLRRWIRVAGVICVIVWICVFAVAAIADAQAAGILPSISELF